MGPSITSLYSEGEGTQAFNGITWEELAQVS